MSDFGESDPLGNRRMRVKAGESVQYLKSRFTVTGEMSKTALDNYRKGYEQIDWSSNGKELQGEERRPAQVIVCVCLPRRGLFRNTPQ